MEKYVCYTDGSGWANKSRNPKGVGASAYVVLKDGVLVVARSKSFLNTTNNRQEMLAIISALHACPQGASVDLYSDSQYAINAFSNRSTTSVKNLDLIRAYAKYTSHLGEIRLHWVRGHNGNEWNEYVDKLAHSQFLERLEVETLKSSMGSQPSQST